MNESLGEWKGVFIGFSQSNISPNLFFFLGTSVLVGISDKMGAVISLYFLLTAFFVAWVVLFTAFLVAWEVLFTVFLATCEVLLRA